MLQDNTFLRLLLLTEVCHEEINSLDTIIRIACSAGGSRRAQLHTGPMTDTETTSKVTETINSMDYNTGYQYSVTGSGITPSGNLSPGTGTNNVTIDGVTSSWTGINSRPTFTQTTPGAAFQFTETYQGPGLSQQTIIQRTTEVTSVTDTTSIFTQ